MTLATLQDLPHAFASFSSIAYVEDNKEPLLIKRGDKLKAGVLHANECQVKALYFHRDKHYADIFLTTKKRTKTIILKTPSASLTLPESLRA